MPVSTTPNTPFSLGEWIVDPSLDTLSRGSECSKVEPRTMGVLIYLSERAGQVVSAEELEAAVWKGVVVTSQSVYQSIAQLRRQLGDNARDPLYIATVPRKGYRLVAPVAPLDSTGPLAPPGGAPEPTAAPAVRRRNYPVLLGASSLLLATLLAVALLWSRSAGPAAPVAIAVLPFTDLSTGHDDAPFCEGLTDELTSALADVSEVRVIARDSAAVFRDHRPDVRRIGAALGVSHLLEGSVRRDGKRVRVTAALVDARSGVQIWSRSMERSAQEVLGAQESVARDVIAALKVHLSARTRARLAVAHGANVSAYELYLLGRYHQQQRTPASIERAIGYERAALEQDRDFALAYAGLADAYMGVYYYQARSLTDTAPLVEQAVAEALRRDPNLAEAYAARGVLRSEQSRLDEAIADLRKASILKPNYADALIRLGAAYEYRGEPRESLDAYDQALEIDPLNFVLHQRRCLVLQNLARFGEADRACARAIELMPDHPNGYWTTALDALAEGDLPRALSGYRQALAHAPWRTDLQSQLAWLELDLGLEQQALKDLEAARLRGTGDRVSLAIERAFVIARTAKPSAVADALRGIDLGAISYPQQLADAALLQLLANDPAAAQSSATRAERLMPVEHGAMVDDVWQTRWGRSALLAFTLCARARGDTAAAERYLAQLSGWLDYLERNGHVWAGLHYLRADVHALRGRSDDALRELGTATRLGWRRAWWMRVDPALESVRADTRFAALLAHIASANASDQARLTAR